MHPGWQKLCKGPSLKSLDLDENFNIRCIKICRDLRTILEIIGQKKCFFGSKTVFLEQEMHHYMVGIANYTELNMQICNYAQKRRICRA